MNHYDRLDRLGTERQQVKDAAQRLLSGTARASNGTTTVAALAREAGINRTSLYQRHPDLIAEFKAGTARAVTPATQALKAQLDAASARITELEAENARLRGRVRALTALAVEMSLETDGTATVIPLKRLTPHPAPRERRHVNPPAQAPDQPAAPARYLNGKLVTAIATDYGNTLTLNAIDHLLGEKPVDPAAADALHTLHEYGIHLLVASNTTPGEKRWPALQKAGIDGLFRVALLSYPLGVRKPAPCSMNLCWPLPGARPARCCSSATTSPATWQGPSRTACAPPSSGRADCAREKSSPPKHCSLVTSRSCRSYCARHDHDDTEHAVTPAEDHLATAGQDPLANLREAIAAARAEAGLLLACLRHTAGLSQARLADQIGYSATVVAHAELGRRPVSADFWELADDALAAGGKLTAQGIRIRDLATARREEQRRRDRARHARQLAQLPPQPHGDDSTASAALAPALTTPAAGRCPHCNQPVTLVTQIATGPETWPDRNTPGR